MLLGSQGGFYRSRDRLPPARLGRGLGQEPFGAAVGTMNWKTAPRGDCGDAQRRPPWASTIDRQIDSPMPMPLGFVVKKGSKRRSMVSGASPGPESSTAISTAPGPSI